MTADARDKGDARVTVRRLIDLEAAEHAGADTASAEPVAGIERIFRETAARWPDDRAAARAFHELWLGQYLKNERDLVLVALLDDRASGPVGVVGYLVGCRIDPAKSERFATLDYFREFATMSAEYPAHLHVNVDAAFRGLRVGERLVETLCATLAAEGIPGVHVVTGRDQRNVGFYRRLGFREMARTPRGTTEVLFLARRLGVR